MDFFNKLKEDKDYQKQVLSKIQSMPWLVKGAAITVNVGSRALVPFFWIADQFKSKLDRNHLELSPQATKLVEDKLDKYLSRVKLVSDKDGFIESQKCDSLLFTGLLGASGVLVNIDAARAVDGSWQRRPCDRPCYPGESASTISRDMLLGLLWYIWKEGKLNMANELWDYGVKHSWIMGEGDPSRIYMTPGLQATLAEIIYQLGGKNHWVARKLPQTWQKHLDGYQAHLEVLHIMLRGELLGYINNDMMTFLKNEVDRNPYNGLPALGVARYTKAGSQDSYIDHVTLCLLDEIFWPSNTFPNAAGRDVQWLFQGDPIDFKGGGDPQELFSGGDYIYLATLLLDYAKGV